MNPLQKLKQFLINLLGRKPTKISKPTTINFQTTETIKISSSNIASKKPSPDVQIKQVEHKQQQKTITSFTEQIPESVTEFSPAVIPLHIKRISELKPGYLWDTCSIMNTEDYPEILKYGSDIINKLYNGPMYVLTLSNYEYANKKCPKNYNEKVIDRGFTGKPRDLHSTLLKLSKSLQVPIIQINIKNSLEIQQLAKKLLPKLHNFGLHKGDDIFLAFAKLTKSILITSDNKLILSSVQAQCPKAILFQDFLEKMIQPSPITVVLRERRNYYKHNPRWRKR